MKEDILSEEGKKEFLNVVNKSGFILEEQAWGIINNINGILRYSRKQVYNYNNGRVEIDFTIFTKEKCFIIECKKADFDWVFTHKTRGKGAINLIEAEKSSLKINSSHNYGIPIAWNQLSLIIKNNGSIEKSNKKDTRLSTRLFNEAILQVLKETDAFLYSGQFKEYHYVMPVIITNANLYYMDYDEKDIDLEGNLKNFKNLSPIKRVAYNFPIVMDWESRNYGIYASTYQPKTTKTIFIVNIKDLKSFLSDFID